MDAAAQSDARRFAFPRELVRAIDRVGRRDATRRPRCVFRIVSRTATRHAASFRAPAALKARRSGHPVSQRAHIRAENTRAARTPSPESRAGRCRATPCARASSTRDRRARDGA